VCETLARLGPTWTLVICDDDDDDDDDDVVVALRERCRFGRAGADVVVALQVHQVRCALLNREPCTLCARSRRPKRRSSSLAAAAADADAAAAAAAAAAATRTASTTRPTTTTTIALHTHPLLLGRCVCVRVCSYRGVATVMQLCEGYF